MAGLWQVIQEYFKNPGLNIPSAGERQTNDTTIGRTFRRVHTYKGDHFYISAPCIGKCLR